jgi:hypothetical protein
MNCQPQKLILVFENFPAKFWITFTAFITALNRLEMIEKVDEVQGIN